MEKNQLLRRKSPGERLAGVEHENSAQRNVGIVLSDLEAKEP